MGRSIAEAKYVPIAPDQVAEAMSRWEKYLHSDAPDVLVQLALIHAEFEAVHPFLDGNGRIGRMLVPLFLFERKLLHTPMFYLSEYLEGHREEYYDRLLAVSRDDDWMGWCEYFLRAITVQATTNDAKARQILDLYERKKQWIVRAIRSQYAIVALDFIFSHPVFQSSHFGESTKIPEASTRRILRLCADAGLLRTVQSAGGRRPTVYAFAELVNIAEGRAVF